MNCSKCGVELTSENWYKCYQKNPRRFLCSKCSSEINQKYDNSHSKEQKRYRQNYYVLNKQRIQILQKKNRADRKLKVLVHYSGNPPRCACCGEQYLEFLTVDHVGGNGNNHRRKNGLDGGNAFYLWLIRENYPQGFQVLCMNCNFAKGKYGYCPHQH